MLAGVAGLSTRTGPAWYFGVRWRSRLAKVYGFSSPLTLMHSRRMLQRGLRVALSSCARLTLRRTAAV